MSPSHANDATGPLPVEPMPHRLVISPAEHLPAWSASRLAGPAGHPARPDRQRTSGHLIAFRGLLFGFHFWLGPDPGGDGVRHAISHMHRRRVGRRLPPVRRGRVPQRAAGCWSSSGWLLAFGYNRLFPWAHPQHVQVNSDADRLRRPASPSAVVHATTGSSSANWSTSRIWGCPGRSSCGPCSLRLDRGAGPGPPPPAPQGFGRRGRAVLLHDRPATRWTTSSAARRTGTRPSSGSSSRSSSGPAAWPCVP